MSAYSFGKIATDDCEEATQAINHLAVSCGIRVTFGFHEPDDREILDESQLLRGEGVVFNLFTPGDADVVTLCNEALEAGLKAIRTVFGEAAIPYSWERARTLELPDQVHTAILATRLGRFVDGLFRIERARGAGFAVFENGVQQLIQDTSANCRFLILRALLLPWDLGPSALFVWPAQQMIRAGEHPDARQSVQTN